MKIFRIFPKYILKDLLYDIKLKIWQDILSGNKRKFVTMFVILKHLENIIAFIELYNSSTQ